MTTYNGERWSSSRAYLDKITKKDNIKVITGCLVDRLIFSKQKCKGVRFFKNNQQFEAECSAGVILSSGAIGSPSILQRSGIGSPHLLKKIGIEPFLELKGVGGNLQDHLELYFQVQSKLPVTLYRYSNNFSKLSILLRWLFFKSGIGASNQFETLAFLKTKKRLRYPNLQYHFLPIAINYDGSSPFKGHGFQFHVGTMRSKSRGFIEIKSKDPYSSPNIQFNYLSHSDDLKDFRDAIKISRTILEQEAFKKYAEKEIFPGSRLRTESELNSYIKSNVESAYHPCGTCKMGDKKDPYSVVTPDCKVKGIDHLFCADSSIFPSITNGNINAPSLMVGEKAVDHILNKYPLPKDNSVPSL
jgi:choline dehydrogenase